MSVLRAGTEYEGRQESDYWAFYLDVFISTLRAFEECS